MSSARILRSSDISNGICVNYNCRMLSHLSSVIYFFLLLSLMECSLTAELRDKLGHFRAQRNLRKYK